MSPKIFFFLEPVAPADDSRTALFASASQLLCGTTRSRGFALPMRETEKTKIDR